MKQTAVEFLINQLGIKKDGWNNDVLKKAKEMFEKQVIEAHLDGQTTWDVTSKTAEKYYNKTFKSE